jgi:methyltransferase (TIGR00027 family)
VTAAPFAGTARWIAAARARESARPDRLFDDPYAAALAGPAGVAAMEASERAAGGENRFLPVRTRWFDDVLLDAAAEVDQAVLLGAGLDTRAFRLLLPERLRLYEVDQAAVMEDKERTLAGLGARPRCRRAGVAADLAGAWAPALLAAGFDPGSRTAWLAEGLLFYLSEDAVRALLREAARLSAGGGLLAADVFGTGVRAQPAMASHLAWRERAGLPPPFATDDPAGLLAACGWRLARITGPGAPDASFGRLPIASRPAAPGPDRTHLVTATA